MEIEEAVSPSEAQALLEEAVDRPPHENRSPRPGGD